MQKKDNLEFKEGMVAEKDLPLFDKYFRSEKHLCDFIEDNIQKFSQEWLGEDIKEYHKEWYLSPLKTFSKNKPRIDFMIITVSGKRIGIECKNTTQVYHESTRAISQLLSYDIVAEQNSNPFDEIIFVSTQFDATTYRIIKKYKLPIRYLVMGRKFTVEAL